MAEIDTAGIRADALPSKTQTEAKTTKPEVNLAERRRLIVHLGRLFSNRYDIQVIPSGQKGVWACGLDPGTTKAIEEYIHGKRTNLDDLPEQAFRPTQILYDEQAIEEMSMENINTLLRHESGHAKYTDFRSMIEGQKQAKTDGYLPTSFWLLFEGIEDPRVNIREGDESPTIDRMIRENQGKDLQDRLTEKPIIQRPLMWQFAYDCLYYYVHGETIPELKGSEIDKVFRQTQPLIDLYFQNTDLNERKDLQKQIWDIVKQIEQKAVEQEEMKEMAKKRQCHQNGDQENGQSNGLEGIMDKLEKAIQGKDNGDEPDLSELSDQEIKEIQEAIDQMTPQEKERLQKKAREALDQKQKQELEDKLPKIMKLEKNKKTGEWEAVPQSADAKQQNQAQKEYQQALKEVETEEAAEAKRIADIQKLEEERQRKIQQQLREKIEMQKNGFDPKTEKTKYYLYRELEESMRSQIYNFRKAMEMIIPRHKEPDYEGIFFGGKRIDKRELVRKVPIKSEQFWQRQTEIPTGEPRLFIGLCIDNSGSMRGPKMEHARKTAIFFSRVCQDMDIPFMITSFGSNAETIKKLRDDFDDPSKRIKPKLIDATDASANSTNLYDGLELTIKAMNEEKRRLQDSHGLIFVITDGAANAGLTGRELRQYIEENKGRLTFKAFGLSASQAERASIQTQLDQYFGESNCTFPQSFEDLPGESFRLLRKNMNQFKRFLVG